MGKLEKEEITKTFFEDYQSLIESFEPFVKDAENPFFKSRYVKLPDILPVMKKMCHANNFILIQHPSVTNEGVSILTTKLIHKTGEMIVGKVQLVHKPEDPQKLGASITYMRRYSLTCMLGLEEVDDDGNFASDKDTKKNFPKEERTPSGNTKLTQEQELEHAKYGRLLCAECDQPIYPEKYVRGDKTGQYKTLVCRNWKHRGFKLKVESKPDKTPFK